MAYAKAIYKTKGATTSYGGGGTTQQFVTPPAGINAGDLIVLCTIWKAGTGTPTMYTPTDFNPVGAGYTQYNAGAGTQGQIDQGPVHASIFYKIAVGGESTQVAVTFSGSVRNVQSAMFIYSKPYDTEWGSMYGFAGYDVTAGTAWSSVNVNSNTIQQGETVVTCIAANTDNYTFSSKAFSQTGLTFTNTVRTDEALSTGLAERFLVNDHHASSGTSSTSSWNYTMTASGSGTGSPTGVVIGMLIRIVPYKPLKRFYISGWKRADMKRYNGSSWDDCAVNISGLKSLKRYTGASWEKVSTLYLKSDPMTYNISSAAQTIYPTIYNGHETDIQSNAGWITLQTASDAKVHKNAFALGLVVALNSGTARTGQVFLSIEGILYRTITVNQAEGSDYISLSNYNCDFDWQQNVCTGYYATVYSSGYWSAYWQNGTGYFYADTMSGYNNYTTYISCNSLNYDYSTRYDTLVLTCGSATTYLYCSQGPYGSGCA